MSKDSNRNTMPEVARLVDNFRALFGDVKVTYAKEGGKELGKPDDDIGIPLSDMVIDLLQHRGKGARDRLREDALAAMKNI